MLHTNIGIDPVKVAQEEARRLQSMLFDAAYERRERNATIGASGATNDTPEVVEAGTAADTQFEFSYENDQGKVDREAAQIRRAREMGYLKQRQIVVHPDHVEHRYDGEAPIKSFARKEFCIRCRNAPFQTEREQRDQHEKLRAAVPYPYRIPDNVMDHCGFCGARLGGRQEVA